MDHSPTRSMDLVKRSYVPPSTPRTPSHPPGHSGGTLRTPSHRAPYSNRASLAVFLRVRPSYLGVGGADPDAGSGRSTCRILDDQSTLRTHPPAIAGNGKSVKRQIRDFAFSRVYGPEAWQEDIYDGVVRPLVDEVFAKRNGLLFAYGMANAGKSFTVMGDEDHPGLISQALTDIFERVGRLGDAGVPRVEMSFLEIYIENVYDLLSSPGEGDLTMSRSALKLDDRMGMTRVRDLSKHVVTCAASGMELVKRAAANRTVASKKHGEDSLRSHSVCMIKLVREDSRESNLWVVDLAGSERSGRGVAGATSTRQKEANTINKGLSTLWHCLHIMRTNMRKDQAETRVPSRESKLTHLFKNHLQGPSAGRTVMIVHINPSAEDYDETQAVLKNSAVARDVKAPRDGGAAARPNGLVSTPLGFNGRGREFKKPSASRRSIHQPVAPKLEALATPPRRTKVQSPASASRGGSGSDVESAKPDEDHHGYVSGAESDSGLVDTRQSVNLVVKNLQAENETLRRRLKAVLDEEEKAAAVDLSGYEPVSGGPVEMYISDLEDKVSAYAAQKKRMTQEHLQEREELERELEMFLEENGLDGGKDTKLLAESQSRAANMQRLQEEVREAQLDVVRWKKEAETLRSMAEGMEGRTSLAKGGNKQATRTSRSPLRPSSGSPMQGPAPMGNRPVADVENSPPGSAKVNVGPRPGGVGSPSTKATRIPSPPRAKPSALPSKGSKKLSRSLSRSPPKIVPCSSPRTATPTGVAPPAGSGPGSGSRAGSVAIPERQRPVPPPLPTRPSVEDRDVSPSERSRPSPPGGPAGGYESLSPPGSGVSGRGYSQPTTVATSPADGSLMREASAGSSVSLGVYSPADSVEKRASKGKVVIAVSRRVSVLRPSTTGSGRRSSSVRSSYATGRRASRASVTGRRTSQSWARSSGAGSVESRGDGGKKGFGYGICPPLRRASSRATLADEDNFFEKARRVLLRAIGVGGNKGGMARQDSGASVAPAAPVSAAELEKTHKIKVKMPKRPGRKGLDRTSSGPLWLADGEDAIVETTFQPPAETPAGAVMTGIERWVFGAESDQKRTPERSQGARSPSASPVPARNAKSRTIRDDVRAF